MKSPSSSRSTSPPSLLALDSQKIASEKRQRQRRPLKRFNLPDDPNFPTNPFPNQAQTALTAPRYSSASPKRYVDHKTVGSHLEEKMIQAISRLEEDGEKPNIEIAYINRRSDCNTGVLRCEATHGTTAEVISFLMASRSFANGNFSQVYLVQQELDGQPKWCVYKEMLVHFSPSKYLGGQEEKKSSFLIDVLREINHFKNYSGDCSSAVLFVDAEHDSPFISDKEKVTVGCLMPYQPYHLATLKDPTVKQSLMADFSDIHGFLEPLKIDHALSSFVELWQSLTVNLHEKNLSHKDIKPENILCDASGKAMLADFGLTQKIAARSNTIGSAGGGDHQLKGSSIQELFPNNLLAQEAVLCNEKYADLWSLVSSVLDIVEDALLDSADSSKSNFNLVKFIAELKKKEKGSALNDLGNFFQKLLCPTAETLQSMFKSDFVKTSIKELEAIQEKYRKEHGITPQSALTEKYKIALIKAKENKPIHSGASTFRSLPSIASLKDALNTVAFSTMEAMEETIISNGYETP